MTEPVSPELGRGSTGRVSLLADRNLPRQLALKQLDADYLQVRLETPSLTRVLTVNYLRPMPIQTELRMEARLERSEGRRHNVKAYLVAGTAITAEAEGVFLALKEEAFVRLFETAGGKAE